MGNNAGSGAELNYKCIQAQAIQPPEVDTAGVRQKRMSGDSYPRAEITDELLPARGYLIDFLGLNYPLGASSSSTEFAT